MGIVYQSERATIYHAKALDVLPQIATESIGAVVTDPPYGVEWESGMRSESFGMLANDGADDRAEIIAIMHACVRVVGQGRHLYAFGPEDVWQGAKVSEPTSLIWDKGRVGMGDLSAPWGPAHEPISFVVSKHRHAGQAGKPNLAVRMRKGSVLRFNPPTGRKVRHPSEKPVALMRELIESSTRSGDIVLDPFAGSGSTGVAAVLSGRRAVLIDMDERWAALSAQRIAAAERAVDMGEVA